MSELSEHAFGPAGSPDAARSRLEWAERRVRLVAMGSVSHGVPYHEDAASQSYLLLPFTGQSEEVIQAAAEHIRRQRDVTSIAVGYIDVDGYPLQGDVLPLRVLLATRGNPDHGQDPARPAWGMPPDRIASAASLDEARQLVRAYLDDNEVGGGQWVGGDVWQGGRRLGVIAYNGRFFEADAANGYGRSSVEFAERQQPAGAGLRRLLGRAGLDDVMDDLDCAHVPDFALSRFEHIRSADAWRGWYAAEVEKTPALGARTLAPVVDPVLVELRDDEAHVSSEQDAWRIGAAFLRGDSVVNVMAFDALHYRAGASLAP